MAFGAAYETYVDTKIYAGTILEMPFGMNYKGYAEIRVFMVVFVKHDIRY